ncbi:MAG: GerMN domain-containing protein [Chloroflexi bacterium]|nr:GerMN domain-containing protein [Chloroflexota bacterium]
MRAKILIVFAALFFSGCVTVENPAPQPQTKPNPPATELILESTATRSAPTLAPIATRPAPTSEPTLTSPTTRVKIFLIALEDNGKTGKKIGCNDSAVAVERVIPATTAPLRAALEELFSLRDRNYGQSGLYNVLYQSNLKLESASIAETKATIHISGALRLSGICDNPRVEAQIEQTALQFSTVKSVDVFLNNVALEKVLSQK